MLDTLDFEEHAHFDVGKLDGRAQSATNVVRSVTMNGNLSSRSVLVSRHFHTLCLSPYKRVTHGRPRHRDKGTGNE